MPPHPTPLWENMKRNYKQLYQELKNKSKSQGYKVKEVSDKVTEDYVGMNPKAGDTIGFEIPKDTIYIDRNLTYAAKYHTLNHELIEIGLMKKGMSYWIAHKKALKKEGE